MDILKESESGLLSVDQAIDVATRTIYHAQQQISKEIDQYQDREIHQYKILLENAVIVLHSIVDCLKAKPANQEEYELMMNFVKNELKHVLDYILTQAISNDLRVWFNKIGFDLTEVERAIFLRFSESKYSSKIDLDIEADYTKLIALINTLIKIINAEIESVFSDVSDLQEEFRTQLLAVEGETNQLRLKRNEEQRKIRQERTIHSL